MGRTRGLALYWRRLLGDLANRPIRPDLTGGRDQSPDPTSTVPRPPVRSSVRSSYYKPEG